MKRFGILLTVFSVGIAMLFAYQVAAQDDTPAMTEAHILRIKANCVDAQSTLSQLHASDALLRVNRGQLYESISTKLMAPFNSRVSLNKLDGANLVTVAANYEKQLTEFRVSYQQYEEAMTKTLRINCANQPVAFYDSVADTRTKRRKVHDSTTQLHQIVRDYKAEFEIFAKQVEGAKQ